MNYLSGGAPHQAAAEAAKRRRDEIVRLRETGSTVTAIAAMLGVSKQRVSAIIKRAKAEQRPS